MISVNGLSKSYKNKCIFNNVSLEISENTAIFGPNGSGKSTFLKLVSGIIYPDEGTITIQGYDVIKNRENALRDVGIMVDPIAYPAMLKVKDIIKFITVMNNISNTKIIEIIKLLDINSKLYNSKYKELSMGEKKKLRLLNALSRDRNLLLLDEPFSNLDPKVQLNLLKLLLDIVNKKESIIVITTHNIKLGLLLVNHAYVINNCGIYSNYQKAILKIKKKGNVILEVKVADPSKYNKILEFLSDANSINDIDIEVVL